MSAVGYDVLNIARSEEPVQLILGYFFSQLLCCGGGGGVFFSPKLSHLTLASVNIVLLFLCLNQISQLH